MGRKESRIGYAELRAKTTIPEGCRGGGVGRDRSLQVHGLAIRRCARRPAMGDPVDVVLEYAFPDKAITCLLGRGNPFPSLYHLTVGGPIEDTA